MFIVTRYNYQVLGFAAINAPMLSIGCTWTTYLSRVWLYTFTHDDRETFTGGWTQRL